MGQATIDDPLSKPPSPLSGADDLLSQMAGEQIDRMLAESESTKAVAAPIDPFASQLDELFNQLDAPPIDAPPRVEKSAPIISAIIEALPPPPSIITEIEQPTTPAERAALAPVEPMLSSSEISAAVNQVQLDHTPIFVRLLELINAPFAFCPDVLRDMLGKVAILTMMNSLAVLIYVLLFRKH